MIRYKRGLAGALGVLMALTALSPITALAAGTAVETPVQTLPAETGAEDGTAEPQTELPESETGATEQEEAAVPSGPRVVFNWTPLALDPAPALLDGTMFVPVAAFCQALGCTVSVPGDGSVYVTRDDLSLLLIVGSSSVWANGRHWFMDEPCTLIGGVPMIPVRTFGKIFSCTVLWVGDTQTAYLNGGEALATAEQFYDAEDLLWLARIIWCEAGNQPLEGKVAVGNVILNRVKSPTFPDNIYDVIFDRSCGVQFTPTVSGKIYCNPTEACYEAARLALEGYETAPGCLYFASLRSSRSCWAARNRPCFGAIAGHVFYL